MEIKKAAMWKKLDKNGKEYFSIAIELNDGSKVSLALFENKFKKQDNHPDFTTPKPKEEKNDLIPF
jgi:uncharacterized protein (DUF736 family)